MDLTIIIPTYNRNSHLVECLQSLEHNNAECIVVDDGSPIPVQVAPNIRLIRHDRNRGRAAAVNTGLRAASHNLVLIIDDDIYAAPDMVSRLADEFAVWNNPKLALTGRVVWDPEVKMTLTMRWLEESGPFREISNNRSGVLSNLATGNTMMWRPFVLQHGGFDEKFTPFGLADVELGLRLKQSGLEVRLLAAAIGFHHKTMRVRDFVTRELQEGMSAVYLHSKFPDYLPQIDDTQSLLRNATVEKDAISAVEEIALLEQADSSRLQTGVSDLFMLIHRYYFLAGILNGLKVRDTSVSSSGLLATLGLYNHASHLESTGDLSEARRLFRLVRSRQDSEFWAGAEYHLGLVESQSGEMQLARTHFINCLKLEPNHEKAREFLKQPASFREIEKNVFERMDLLPKFKILFALFGELEDVVCAFPVVAGLRLKFPKAEIHWLTSPEYTSLARASLVDGAYEFEPKGAIPWDWVKLEEYSHVFQPEIGANGKEWEASGLHRMDFMAQKCGVELASRIGWLEPGSDAVDEAESFLDEVGLIRNKFLTMSYTEETRRLWPCHNLHKLATAIGMPVVVIGGSEEKPIAGTISCFGRSHRVAAALIASAAFYLGPDSGMSWIAATTHTPMGVLRNSTRTESAHDTFSKLLRIEKEDLTEWDTNTSAVTVIEHILTTVSSLNAMAEGRNNPAVSRR